MQKRTMCSKKALVGLTGSLPVGLTGGLTGALTQHKYFFSMKNISCLNLVVFSQQIRQNIIIFVVVIVRKRSVEMSSALFCNFFFQPVGWWKSWRKSKTSCFNTLSHPRDVRTNSFFNDSFSQSDDRVQGSPVKTSVMLKLQREQYETRSGIFCESMCFLANFLRKFFNL